jgi:hypothetical protein
VDDIVLAAIAKWPNVPAVFGWLSLTARGEWRIRGERIGNRAIVDFIGRNYAVDNLGRWFFQNGPQRVFVELEATPWVYRLAPGEPIAAHTGARPLVLDSAALLDDGRVVLVTDLGAGLVDDRDVALFLRAVTDFAGLPLSERGLERWFEGKDEAFVSAATLGLRSPARRLERLHAAELPARCGFVRMPEA